jgi:hypothetical protein
VEPGGAGRAGVVVVVRSDHSEVLQDHSRSPNGEVALKTVRVCPLKQVRALVEVKRLINPARVINSSGRN